MAQLEVLIGKRELVALLSLSSCCLVIVVWLFYAVPRVCLQFVIVVFPDHTHNFFCSLRPCGHLLGNTPASNLGYLASPGQFFMGAQLFIGTPWMRNEGVLKQNWFGL